MFYKIAVLYEWSKGLNNTTIMLFISSKVRDPHLPSPVFFTFPNASIKQAHYRKDLADHLLQKYSS